MKTNKLEDKLLFSFIYIFFLLQFCTFAWYIYEVHSLSAVIMSIHFVQLILPAQCLSLVSKFSLDLYNVIRYGSERNPGVCPEEGARVATPSYLIGHPIIPKIWSAICSVRGGNLSWSNRLTNIFEYTLFSSACIQLWVQFDFEDLKN